MGELYNELRATTSHNGGEKSDIDARTQVGPKSAQLLNESSARELRLLWF